MLIKTIFLISSSDSIGNQQCSLAQMKSLIEQNFSIIIDESQFENLVRFLRSNTIKADESNNEEKIDWIDLFKKFSSIE